MMEEKKVVSVTGCSSGFGFLTALKFARNGWQVFAGIRNLESAGAKELWEIKKKENLSLEILPLDVTSQLSVEEAVGMAVRKAGRIDVLVNNAGFGYLGPVEDFTIEEVKSQYETNVFGVLRMVKAVVPIMRKRSSGLIVNLSSISGLVSFPLFGVYSSSKFALETLSESLRFELKPFGVDVVLLEPGSFFTRFAQNRRHPKAFGREDSPYRKLAENFFRRYQKTHDKARASFISKAADPQKVADLIYGIAQQKNPGFRHLVGGDAYFSYFIRKILPFGLWEWFLHRAYDW